MELLIALALDQRRDAVLRVRFEIREAAEVSEVERAVAQRFDRGVIARGNNQLDRLAHRRLEIIFQRFLLLHGDLRRTGIGNHTDTYRVACRLSNAAGECECENYN